MSRIKFSLDIAEDLKRLAGSLESLAEAIESNAEVPVNAEEAKAELIPIETVRAVLAEKSQSGKQPEVKALIAKYGSNKLTNIDPARYSELLKDAGNL